MKITFAATAATFLLGGCGGNSEVEEFNKPALYWYKKIGENISGGHIDKADGYYISLKSEHMRSPLMPTAMLMLAYTHMQEEEYLLANYYLDEYSKRFGESSNREYIEFMKIKASFMGIKEVYKDQKLIKDTISHAEVFLDRYPGSEYSMMVGTILVKLHMTQYLLNENIASLYDRTGKGKAAEIYRQKNEASFLKQEDIKAPEQGIVGQFFE